MKFVLILTFICMLTVFSMTVVSSANTTVQIPDLFLQTAILKQLGKQTVLSLLMI